MRFNEAITELILFRNAHLIETIFHLKIRRLAILNVLEFTINIEHWCFL